LLSEIIIRHLKTGMKLSQNASDTDGPPLAGMARIGLRLASMDPLFRDGFHFHFGTNS
jgi:hypothetical protein